MLSEMVMDGTCDVILVLSLTSYQMLHIFTCCHQSPRRATVFPSWLHLYTPIGYILKEWVWILMSSIPLVRLKRQEVPLERHIHKPLPTPCSLLHTSNPSFCYGRGCTLAFTKQPQHATLPDSTSLPSLDTDRLNWAESRLEWTVWHALASARQSGGNC